jgi:hypothetical protein
LSTVAVIGGYFELGFFYQFLVQQFDRDGGTRRIEKVNVGGRKAQRDAIYTVWAARAMQFEP